MLVDFPVLKLFMCEPHPIFYAIESIATYFKDWKIRYINTLGVSKNLLI